VSSSLTAALLACGGSAKAPPVVPAGAPAAGDVCAAGIHVGPASRAAASWAEVATALGVAEDELCGSGSPCGPDEALSVVGAPDQGAVAVKLEGGYQVTQGLWAAYSQTPTIRVTDLDGLVHLAVAYEELGREEACLDGEDPEAPCGTATVIVATSHDDVVLDPSSGQVVWRAACTVDGETAAHATTVTRDADGFLYTACMDGATVVRFTAAQAAACPAPPTP